jgi:uncharacterized protein
VPPLRAHVMDRVGLLSPATRDSLEQSLADFEQTTGHQIVVHVTPSLEGLTIEDYSIQVAEAWKVGQKGLDNGVILTIAPSQRELRIEVGYGLEGVLPDAIASRIVHEVIEPEFRAGHMDQGVVAGVRAIEDVTQGEKLPLPERRPSPRREVDAWQSWVKLVWLVVVLLILFGRTPLLWALFGIGLPRFPRYGTYRSGPWGGGWSGGGGFGGGGGFSGGGGGFGGGGASGRW